MFELLRSSVPGFASQKDLLPPGVPLNQILASPPPLIKV
jgi:hypothetical protein